jgi:hypothetical protein
MVAAFNGSPAGSLAPGAVTTCAGITTTVVPPNPMLPLAGLPASGGTYDLCTFPQTKDNARQYCPVTCSSCPTNSNRRRRLNLLPMVNLGNEGCRESSPCSACEGDCDTDSDCAGDLLCKQRDTSTDFIPGCTPGGVGDVHDHDYCYDPTSPTFVLPKYRLAPLANRGDFTLSSAGCQLPNQVIIMQHTTLAIRGDRNSITLPTITPTAYHISTMTLAQNDLLQKHRLFQTRGILILEYVALRGGSLITSQCNVQTASLLQYCAGAQVYVGDTIGALLTSNVASLQATDCLFTEGDASNHANDAFGGSIVAIGAMGNDHAHVNQTHVILKNSTITNNTAAYGSGVALFYSAMTLVADNKIAKNIKGLAATSILNIGSDLEFSLCRPGKIYNPSHVAGFRSPDIIGCPSTCEPGTYAPTFKKRTGFTCPSCPSGHFCPSIYEFPQICAAGRYQTKQRQTTLASCLPCRPGMYQTKQGSSQCIFCAPGKFAAQHSRHQCTGCSTNEFNEEEGLTNCTACPLGWTSKIGATTQCIACSPGRFANEKSDVCEACPAGFLQPDTAGYDCSPVASGQIVAKGGSAAVVVPLGSRICKSTIPPNCDCEGCVPFLVCATGTIGDIPPTTACKTCPAGKSSVTGGIECQACDKGRFNPTSGGTCKNCEAKTFQEQSQNPSLKCDNCPAGYAQDKQGESLCISLNWATAEDCKENEYLDNRDKDENKWTCINCPIGGSCAGPITWHTLGPLFGWWKVPEEQRLHPISEWDRLSGKSQKYIMFAKCNYPPACLGAPNPALENLYFDDDVNKTDLAQVRTIFTNQTKSTCATHLAYQNQSRLCHTCNSTSRRQGTGRCETCPDRALTIFLMLFGCLITLGVIGFLVQTAIKDNGKIKLSDSIQKIAINYLQVIAFAQGFPLEWPQFLNDMFELQGAISTVGEHLLSPDCLSTHESAAELFYSQQIMFAMLPIVVVAMSFVFWSVQGCRTGVSFFAKRIKETDTTLKDKCILTISTIMYLLFPTLCKQAFKMFHCERVAGVLYLAADMEEECYTGKHFQWMFLGIAQVLLYVVCLPVLVFVFLRRNKHLDDGNGLKKHATNVRYGLFYGAYKESMYYWEILLTMRKVLVVALSVFGPGIG